MNNDIKHFGILGMKWGVRRERGSDGRVKGKGKPTEDYLRAKELKSKGTKNLTNAELKDVVTRMQLEQQYKDLSSRSVSAGQKFATDILKETGKEIAKESVKQGIKKGSEYLIPMLKGILKKGA